jgi:hypothetical protein
MYNAFSDKFTEYIDKSNRKGRYYIQQNEGRLIGIVILCVGTAF